MTTRRLSTQFMHRNTKRPTGCPSRPLAFLLLGWCAREESNLWPLASEANALSN
jgi:hypothetical protein